MDKRSSARYAISLNALVHPNEGRSWLCAIRDFCSGGMLLTGQDTGRASRSSPGIDTGELVGIHFTVPAKGKEKHFRLEGRIVRVMDTGVGINFANGMDEDAITALLNYSNSIPLSSTIPGARTTRKLGGGGKGTGEAAAGGTRAGAGRRPLGGAERSAPARAGAEARRGKLNTTLGHGSKIETVVPKEEGEIVGKGRSGIAARLRDESPLSRSKIKPADTKRIVASVRREVSKVLPEMNSAFFSYMDEELLKLARDAKTNAEQSEYFAAMSTLEKAKKTVGQSFANEVQDQIDNPRDLTKLLDERRIAEEDRKKQQSRQKLSLVNTDEFEDWLAVANIISRSERTYEKYLQEIRARLGMLVDSWAHVEANPLGTAVFCHAFDNAMREVELTKEIRQKVYSGFEAKAIPLFRKLYLAVTKLLEESKLFPDFDADYVAPTSNAKRKIVNEDRKTLPDGADEVKAEEEETEDEDDFDESEANPRKAARRRGNTSAAPGSASKSAAGAGQRRQTGESRGRSGRRTGGVGASTDLGEAIANVYSTVRNLSGGAEELDDDQEYVDFDEVQELLSALRPARRGARSRIKEQVMRAAPRRVSPDVVESLEVVENLVDTIESDSMLSGSAKDWIRQLELTLDKVATQNENFLSDEAPHNALEVINQLAMLSGAETGSMRRNVDSIVDNINRTYDEDPGVIDEALTELKPLVERQSRAFTGNIQRTVKASEGQQTLLNAQRAVVDELSGRLTGRHVPEVFMKLLMPGWRNLMVNTHLRQGEDSADWKRHVDALDQVVQHLDGTADRETTENYMEPDELLDYIDEGLDSISFEPGQRVPLINSLRQMLLDGSSGAPVDMVKVPEDSVAETLGFGDVEEKEQRRQVLLQQWGEHQDWHRWMDRARRIHVGDWVEFSGDEQVSIVAWSSEESNVNVFVNRRGVKTHELMVEELAALLAEEKAKVLEESDLPLTDRASHRMLQNMHNRLTHQATHDELTGLVNRKEFERLMELTVSDAKRNGSAHIVAYMDLDQFKVINNAAGHEAGDQLLIRIATLLKTQLGDSEHVLSRLAGNEFGIIINNCAQASGISMIRQLCDAVRSNRFHWDGDTLTLTASCGVVAVSKDVDSASSVMRGADTARYAAKDAGRDRIHVYEMDDSEMSHRRDIMSFVSQIDSALKEDRFILNCQKIAPIDETSGEHAHYEILLTVLDENDEPMPPQDFIVAAETYNRMGAIDRWVIKNAFKWIASNILKLDNFGAFSINISGNSLTEADFMEFVLEQFNETKLPTSKVCFEITETSAIGSLDDAIGFMEKMKVIGVQFSLDDFGTGLSSYSYLRNLPVDYLKIDGIFVKDIKSNPSDYAVVKSINEIGHFMGKKTIAEYVEDDEILAILKEIGVDFAQGYGIERKMPITELV